jgi:hypothetical protein
MKATRWLSVIALATMATSTIRAQDFPKPGPEHEVLKKMVGNWDLTMKVAGAESKGSVTYKMDLGGLWLTSTLESDLFGTKFSGRGLDTYDAGKKKYIGVWVDSMTTSPLVMEGNYDKAKKTMTLVGEGTGMDGKPTKFKAVTEMHDDDTMHFSMYVGDGKDPEFTILYKRKK